MLSRMHIVVGPHSTQGTVHMMAWPGLASEWMAESRAAMLMVIQQLGSTRTLAIHILYSLRRPIVLTLEEQKGMTCFRRSWEHALVSRDAVRTHSLLTMDIMTKV